MSYWDKQRGKLNHDLLKNQIIPSLDRLRRIANGYISGDGLLEDATTHLLRVWSEFHPAISVLLNTDREGGPEEWFSEPPLNRLGEWDRNWMQGLISAHVSRTALVGRERVVADLDALDRDLRKLVRELIPAGNASVSRRLMTVRKKMSAFSDRLSALSSSSNEVLSLVLIPEKSGRRSEA